MDRRHQDVRRLVVTELHDQLSKIGFESCDANRLQCLVESDLLGGHGLDLDHLIHTFGADQIDHLCVGLLSVPGPVHDAAARGHRRFQLGKVIRQMRHGVDLQLATRLAQLLPVRKFGNDLSPFGPDRCCCLAEVAPQLGVGEHSPGRRRELLFTPKVANTPRGRRRDFGHAQHHRRAHSTRAFSRVAARICARWTVLAPARSRDRPPPICIRQELSPAVQISAPVSST